MDGFDGTYDKTCYLTNYLRLFSFLNMYQEKGCANITYEKYLNEAYLHVYDLTTSLGESQFLRPVTRVS